MTTQLFPQSTDKETKHLHPAEHYVPRLARITVSRVFWKAVQDTFPGLKKHPGYPKLFWYLLFGGWRDKESHRLLLDSRVLSIIEGRSIRRTQAGRFLCSFERDVLPLDARIKWTHWDWHNGKTRQLEFLSLGAFDRFVEHEHRRHWHKLGRVYLDGTPASEKKERKIRREEQAAARSEVAPCEDAKIICDYLHSLPPHSFSSIINDNMAGAIEVALALKNLSARNAQLCFLRHIENQPQPLYYPSRNGNTVRVSSRAHIPNLKSEVRHALTRGWGEADLQNSQLAICASLWKVGDVEKFLATGRSFWSYLYEELGVPPEEQKDVKEVLKPAIYSLKLRTGA